MGSLLAILLKDRANFVEKYAKWVFCLSGLAILIFLGCFMVKDRGLSPLMPECCVPLSQSFIFSGLGLFFSSILVYALADNKFEKILSTRRLIFFGKYSYGIYIFHYPIYATATYCLHQYAPYSSSFNWPAEIMISVGSSSLALGIAYLSYHFYERHFLSLKTRFV
jgi:peptidoglycan/LPS O-acetylase OafA/YrhL